MIVEGTDPGFISLTASFDQAEARDADEEVLFYGSAELQTACVIRKLIAGKVLPWRRFWSPLGGRLSAGHDGRGFMDDPEDDCGRSLNPEVSDLPSLLARPCLVLSGQPGIGKTMEVDRFRVQSAQLLAVGETLISLGGSLLDSQDQLRRRTVDSPEWQAALANGGRIRLLFDGVDEAQRRLPPLVAMLVDLLQGQPLDRLRVVLVCRAVGWHLADGEALSGLWGQGFPPLVHELCPLRRRDVKLAAEESGVDPEAFLEQLERQQVKGLAARPITLRLLLEEMLGKGSLPGSHHELYSRAVLRLCDDDDERLRRLPNSCREPKHLARVAARIGALTLLCGRDIVVRSADDSTPGELPISEIAGGSEMVDDEQFAVTRELVVETLDTPLFSLRGSERYGFDHQTFAEHLAADYLRGCPVVQLRRLLCVSFEGHERIAPQLAEVAARVAATNGDWCDHLILTEPELLLRADATPLSESQREKAMGSLLARAERAEAFDEIGTGYFYHTLRHPRLAEQLRPYISNPSYNPVVRRMALDIAGDAGIAELEPLLWQRIADRDPAFTQICSALSRLVGPHSRERLLSALRDELPDDGGYSLKDLALQKLVPEVMSVSQSLPFLQPPPHENMTFAYGLAKHLVVADLQVVLKEMGARCFVGHHYLGLNELAARVFELAMENLHLPEIAIALAKYWQASVRAHHAQPSRMMATDRDPMAGLEDTRKRRALAELVLTLPGAKAGDVNEGEPSLIRTEDTEWLLEHLPEIAIEHRTTWATLVAWHVWRDLSLRAQVLLRQRYADSPELRARLPRLGRFDIVETIQRLRRRNELRIERASSRYARPNRTELLQPVWQEIDTNDTVWVGFCDHAFKPDVDDPKYEDTLDRADITQSPAWRSTDQTRRTALRGAARRFLVARSDGVRKRGTWSNWAGAACLGITLLRHEIEADSELRHAICSHWPRVMFEDHDRGSLVQRASVGAIYRLVPKVATACLNEKLRDDNRRDGYLSGLHLFVDCWDSRLVEVVRQFLHHRGLKPNSMRRAFQFVDKHDRPSAIALFDEMLISRRGFCPLNGKGRALLSLGLFLLDGQRWDVAWATLKECARPLAQRILLEAAHEFVDRDVKFVDALSTGQIVAFCRNVWQLFPAAEYRDTSNGQGRVSSRHMIPGLREGLTAALVARATPEACAGLQSLTTLVPKEQRVWMHWRCHEAVKNALSRTWAARSRKSAELLTMARDPRTLTIDTADDLLEAVRASLDRLQERLFIAESSQSIALWNEGAGDNPPKPKKESALSNVLIDWLRHDLGKHSGIVLNREVEATKLKKLDIKVEARSSLGPAAPLTVIVEVKGDWNREVKTALGAQLARDYLLPNRWTHGVYLVGWYNERPHRRVRNQCRWPPATLTEARSMADAWQNSQCATGLTILALVLDCSRFSERGAGDTPARIKRK